MKHNSGLVLGIALVASGILSAAGDPPPTTPAAGAAASAPAPRTSRLSPVLRVPHSTADPKWLTLQEIEAEGRWAACESLATDLVASLEGSSPVDSLELSIALLYIANARTKLRVHADGKGFGSLERSLAIRERQAPPDDPLTLWAHVLGATFYTEGGRPDLAWAHAETAVTRIGAAAAPDSALLAQARLGQATSLVALGRHDEARAAYDAGLELREALDGADSRAIVPMLAEYGLFLSRVGDLDRARELLRRAVDISTRDDGPTSDFLSGSLSRLSTVENRAGNLAESLDLAQRAYELMRARDGEDAVTTLRMRTIVAYRRIDFGDFQGAARLLQEIVPAFARGLGETHPQCLTARLSLVECLLNAADTTSVAHELAQVRAALAQQEQFASNNAAYCRMLEADYEVLRGNDEAAREILLATIAKEIEKGDGLGAELALLYVHLLNLMGGDADRGRVATLGSEIDDFASHTSVRATPEWIELLTRRAGAEARVGLREAAWDRALDAEARARDRMTHQLQALPDASALRLAQSLGAPCELLVHLTRSEREGELSDAWDRVIRWRGLVRHEISRRRPAVLAATDTSVAAAHSRWMTAQRRLGQLMVSGAAHPDDPETAERFERAHRDAEEAERRYVRAARGTVAPSDPVGLVEVLAALQPDQALVAFAKGATREDDASLGAFVANGRERRPHWVALGRLADIEAEVRAWKGCLATPPRHPDGSGPEEAQCRQAGAIVAARLWEPLLTRFAGAREIFVVGEGPVSELPWLALPTSAAGYVADETLTIHQLLAERDLLQPSAAGSGVGMLAVGDPDFDLESSPSSSPSPMVLAFRARQWPCGGTQAVELAPLPGARSEVQELARTWPASAGVPRLLLGEAATEASFKRSAPGNAVLHLATHGVVVDEECVFGDAPAGLASTRGVGGLSVLEAHSSSAAAAASKRPWLGRQVWLALAGASRPPSEAQDENEGLLTAEEVVTLDLRGTDWVVLSACHSALAPSWAREGVLGMRRAFHIAGARAVIASQWPVADDATREWMTALYAARARGERAGAAVTDACRRTLEARRREGRSTHPFYWAAFSASGD